MDFVAAFLKLPFTSSCSASSIALACARVALVRFLYKWIDAASWLSPVRSTAEPGSLSCCARSSPATQLGGSNCIYQLNRQEYNRSTTVTGDEIISYHC